ncbi:MAG: ribosome silencing factor [Candidatus Geothermincolia bacterium]
MTSEEIAFEAARAADDKKATDVRIMDMRETLGITDYFVIVSGSNDRQVKRIRDAVEERLRGHGIKPVRREGERFGRWILLDYIDVVVHVFLDEDREFYNLERLWGNVPTVEWQEGASPEDT